jgi:exodeoxyribonuclease-1
MNFLFYDLETTGLKPSIHRPLQFAAILTDEKLNEIKRVNWLVKLSPEILPDPFACFVTGITPQDAQDGMSEPEFLRKLHEELLLPDTVITGYNTIQFDDEFMRYTLWRNFYDAYEWQWKEGRSRWDIITLVRMTRALRPEGIKWAFKKDGTPTNILGEIAKLNKLVHTNAHDALSDVEVTVDIARMIREKAPKLFDFLLSLRDKKVAESYLDLESPKPVVHTTTRFPSKDLHTSVVYPLCPTPGRAGGVLVYDLRHDPSEFFTLTPAQLKRLTYTTKNNLGKFEEARLPVKMVQFNKCPALAPLEVITPPTAERIDLDLNVIKANLAKLKQGLPAFAQKVYEAYKPEDGKFPPKDDPDQSLYDGFLNDSDRNLSSAVRVAKPKDLKTESFKFEDPRLNKLLVLYKARNFPESLTKAEKDQYEEYKREKFSTSTKDRHSKEEYLQNLQSLRKTKLSAKDQKIIDKLEEWANQD